MKNLMKISLFAIAISASLFSCDNASEPQPDPTPQIEAKQNEASTNGDQAKIASRFQWKLAKTGTFGNGEKAKLQAPIGMGYMVGGDFAFKNVNGRGTLVPLTVKLYNLRNVDKNTVDPAMLNAKRFNSYSIPAANGTPEDNVLYTKTTVAIKDVNGKYYMLEVVQFITNFEIKVNIYEESYFTGQAQLHYELPDGRLAADKHAE